MQLAADDRAGQGGGGGGFATGGHEVKKDEKMYVAPSWFEEQMKDVY